MLLLFLHKSVNVKNHLLHLQQQLFLIPVCIDHNSAYSVFVMAVSCYIVKRLRHTSLGELVMIFRGDEMRFIKSLSKFWIIIQFRMLILCSLSVDEELYVVFCIFRFDRSQQRRDRAGVPDGSLRGLRRAAVALRMLTPLLDH